MEKSRLAHAVRFLHQTSRCSTPSVRHAEADIDQAMVIQLIEQTGIRRQESGVAGEWGDHSHTSSVNRNQLKYPSSTPDCTDEMSLASRLM